MMIGTSGIWSVSMGRKKVLLGEHGRKMTSKDSRWGLACTSTMDRFEAVSNKVRAMTMALEEGFEVMVHFKEGVDTVDLGVEGFSQCWV